MVRHAQVLCPKLWRDRDWLARAQGIVQHRLVQAFWMQIDLYSPPACSYALKDGAPKLIAAFLYTAFAMRAQGHTANRWTRLQQQAQRVAAVETVSFARQAL